MTESHTNALKVSSRVLKFLVIVNLVVGFGIAALLMASLLSGSWVNTALGVADTPRLIAGTRLIMVIGIFGTPLTHLALTRLQAIVETVREGDPFLAVNATRLQLIAWAILGLELLHLGVGIVRGWVSSPAARLDLDWEFSLAPWLAVLLLFVLARVFDQGAQMREELEGTV